MHLLKKEKTKNQFMATTSLSDKMQAMILMFPPQTVFLRLSHIPNQR